jgi:hypothetical protein
MGGRGTFAVGNNVGYQYKTVDKIEDVKVLQGNIYYKGLPAEAHSSSSYIQLYSDGTFKQYREFNADHTAKFDIDYHSEFAITGNYNKVYHIHFYHNGNRDVVGRTLTKDEYEKYKKYFRGKQ